ncbi:peptidoglycan-binding protein [Desulfovibrio sp. UCD-KL4C]|uniref:peptidoglycan-binding domain-containing protein n=1 Tax=Desulfovibrio sp. UCD-KL4C TaxID=2578120 RepID=UPI0025BB4FBE|nr:peptidoglycan-binding domain-containing protein [Desulfovibrio sp. UCD-KL4C]
MAVYRKGSTGDAVRSIQQALKDARYMSEEPDGILGSRTENAIKIFQSQTGLSVDGLVGPATWQRLFSVFEPVRGDFSGDLNTRCLALTGSFETSRLAPDCFGVVTGNFDGQGMSYGALQWNFGQKTLQPLFLKLLSSHREVAESIFGEHLNRLQQAISGDLADAMAFAASIQDPVKKTVQDPWKSLFFALGHTPEFQAIEVAGAASYVAKGDRLRQEYGLWSERAQALMFDICVQNGSIPKRVKDLIEKDFAALSTTISAEESEIEKMRIVANRRAEASNPRFIEDVRRRKLCIAEGKGSVHGRTYDLATQFALSLERVG